MELLLPRCGSTTRLLIALSQNWARFLHTFFRMRDTDTPPERPPLAEADDEEFDDIMYYAEANEATFNNARRLLSRACSWL